MSRQQIDELINKLGKESKPYAWFEREFSLIDELKDIDFDLYNVKLLGLGVALNSKNELCLKSKNTKIKDEIFCVVDIESTGSVKNGQIIEIGAVKIQNGKEIGYFESFVKADEVPENISELTGITSKMLQNAPSLASVLNEFRIFLMDSIFVAHNVKFDYNFISNSLEKCGFGVLLNQHLCTVELSRRLIPSQKYSLATLKELLGIKNTHHRALDDAKAATIILKHCLSKLPFYIQSTQDLLNFSKSNVKPESALLR